MTAPPPSVDPIVEFIARNPGMAARMLIEHGDDRTGHYRVCTTGAQAGRSVWPCPLYGYATLGAQHGR